MPSLISVNVGLPRDIAWRGKIVHTAVWKRLVAGRVMVHRLNLDDNGRGDLAGYGGELRAVMMYRLDSHRYSQATFIGTISYSPGPFDRPAEANALIGCSTP